jgi:hypothetical protein
MARMFDNPDPNKKGIPAMPDLFPIGRQFGPEAAKSDDFKLAVDREGGRFKASKGNNGDRLREGTGDR